MSNWGEGSFQTKPVADEESEFAAEVEITVRCGVCGCGLYWRDADDEEPDRWYCKSGCGVTYFLDSEGRPFLDEWNTQIAREST